MLLRISAIDPDNQIIKPCFSELDRLLHSHIQAGCEEIHHSLLRIDVLYQFKDILPQKWVSFCEGDNAGAHIKGLIDYAQNLLMAQLSLALFYQAMVAFCTASSGDLNGESLGHHPAYYTPRLIQKQPLERAAGNRRQPGTGNDILQPDLGRLFLSQPLVHHLQNRLDHSRQGTVSLQGPSVPVEVHRKSGRLDQLGHWTYRFFRGDYRVIAQMKR